MSAKRRHWSREEIEVLSETAGTLSKAAIARKLKRSYWSVKAECTRLQISSRLCEGYSRRDVECLLGVGQRSIRKWIAMGWLRVQDGRVTEPSIIRFLREHPEEYRLSRVDEAWFKGLLFPAFGLKRNDVVVRAANKSMEPAAEAWLSG
jgi:hypothetical protein